MLHVNAILSLTIYNDNSPPCSSHIGPRKNPTNLGGTIKTDGRRTTRDHNNSLEPSAQVQLKAKPGKVKISINLEKV